MLKMKVLTSFILIYLVYECRSKHIGQSNEKWPNLQNPNEIIIKTEDKNKLILNGGCTKYEEEQRESLQRTSEIIKKNEEEIGKEYSTPESTILVLGNAGSGKTTFVQYMAGDNTKLVSNEVGTNTGKYLINGNKIGSSVTESFTLYPEQQIASNNISITDTPGFSDTRSEIHEVIANYAMKKYTSNIHKVKILLLVTYYSLEQGQYKEDFIDLLKNVNNFVKNIDEYKNSIALIATKVPPTYRSKDSNTILISDKEVITDIAEYLFKVKVSLSEKLADTKEERKIKFLKNAVTILSSLQDVDENGNFKKINIFRRPTLAGALSEQPEFQKNKILLQKTIDNIVYSEITSNDIGYSLSYEAKTYLNCLLQYINENFIKISRLAFEAIDKQYNKEISNYTDIYDINKQLKNQLDSLQKLQNDLKESKSYDKYLTKLESTNPKYLTEEDERKFTEFREFYSTIMSIEAFVDVHMSLSTATWAETTNDILINLEHKSLWKNFLVRLFEHFSKFELQKSKAEFINQTNLNKNNDILKLIRSKIDSPLEDSFNNFNVLKSNSEMISELKEILSITLEEKTNATCTDGQLILIGYYIQISTISDGNYIKTLCKGTPLKTVVLLAMHTIFIDSDINDECFKGIKFLMAAPKWEIVGSRVINIDGTVGGIHNKFQANSGQEFGERGMDGKPGLPGGNGGNFLGVGLQFINEENLLVSANGGEGGFGQHGGLGFHGQPGRGGKEKFSGNFTLIEIPYDSFYEGYEVFPYMISSPNNMREVASGSDFPDMQSGDVYSPIKEIFVRQCGANISAYTQQGDCGSDGGEGGDGGKGGLGGYPGNFIIIGDNTTPKLIVHNSTGAAGVDGLGGFGGLRGESGKPVTCFKINVQRKEEIPQYNRYDEAVSNKYRIIDKKDFWVCKNWQLTKNVSKCDENERGKSGSTGYATLDMAEPKANGAYDFSAQLYNYLTLLKKHESNKFLQGQVKKIENVIYNNVFLKTNDFWKFILVPQVPTV